MAFHLVIRFKSKRFLKHTFRIEFLSNWICFSVFPAELNKYWQFPTFAKWRAMYLQGNYRNEKIALRNNRFHTFFSLSFLQLVLQTQSTHQEASQQRRKLQEQSCKWLVWLTSTQFQLEVCFVSYLLNWLTGNNWLAVSAHFKN